MPRNERLSGSPSMSATTESYAHGASDIPLIGETIGASFDRTVARARSGSFA